MTAVPAASVDTTGTAVATVTPAQDLLPPSENDSFRRDAPGLPREEAIRLFTYAQHELGSLTCGLTVERIATTGDPARDLTASVWVVSGFLPTVARARRLPLHQTLFQCLATDDVTMALRRVEDELPIA